MSMTHSERTKWIFGLSGLGLLVAGAAVFVQQTETPGTPAPSVGAPVRVSQLAEPSSVKAMGPVLVEPQAKPGQPVVELPLISLAEPRDALTHLPFVSQEQAKDGRIFVRYALDALAQKGAGETVDVLLPQAGLALRGQIDKVENYGDATRWEGRWSDVAGEPGRFVITQVARDQYATAVYETPLGIYSMEAKNGYGWVISQEKGFHLPADGNDTPVEPGQPAKN